MEKFSIAAETIFNIWGFSISNTFLTSLFTTVILLLAAFFISKKVKERPGVFQNLIEIIIEKLFNFIMSITNNKNEAIQYFSIITTIFLFIILSNLIGLMPGIGSILIKTDESMVPLLRSTNSDLNTTLLLALITVVGAQIIGIRSLKLRYLKKFFNFTNPLKFFLGILELMGEITKIISFSFRLFGNIFAGEVLLVVTMGLFPILFPFPFFLLEIFVGFIQALIFATLTLVFFKLAKAEHS